MRATRLLSFVLGLMFTIATPLFAVADSAPRKLTASVFKGGAVLPLWVGIHNGFFTARGIDLQLIYTQNSRSQMSGLIDGTFETALTAIDNVIAYMEGQGGLPAGTRPELVAVAGAGDGFLSLVTSGDIRSFEDLRGRKVAVDALSTGFAFVLQDMLARAGLKPGDYVLDSVGGTSERWQALEAGTTAGALLTPPFTQIAQKKGFSVLAQASETLGGYQGLVFTLRRAWADENASTVVDFIRAYRASLQWLFDPANRDATIAILRANMPETSEALARSTYDVFVDPKRGLDRDGGIDMAGARNVMEIRSRYTKISPPLADLGRYVDLSYIERAK